MSDLSCPSKEHRVVSLLAVIGVFLIFCAILLVAYLPTQKGDPDSERAAYRKQTRKALDAAMVKADEGYAWLDKSAGDVRIPVAQAMDLTLEAYTAQKSLFTPEVTPGQEPATLVPPRDEATL